MPSSDQSWGIECGLRGCGYFHVGAAFKATGREGVRRNPSLVLRGGRDDPLDGAAGRFPIRSAPVRVAGGASTRRTLATFAESRQRFLSSEKSRKAVE